MIHVLDPVTANGIAAGEVVERPASVVKELIENSLDAGASIIHCNIEQGGIKKIIITDNGMGMSEEDAKLAFKRHATSKLNKLVDLDSLTTMGFRGEALASIAAVSKVTLRTRQIGSEKGFEIKIEAGKIIHAVQVGCPEGTQIEITDLFFNVPARYKFLKRDATEQGYISDLIMRLALARADVSFRLTAKGKDLIHTPGNNNLLSAIYVLMGRETAEAMIEVDYETDSIHVNGYVTSTQVVRGNRGRQVLFVNGRSIQSKTITAAINEASKTWFMKGKFPSLVLNLSIPLNLVDVNVHPQKTEVRFWDEKKIFHAIYHALRKAWEENSEIIKGEIISKKFDAIEPVKIEHEQKDFPINESHDLSIDHSIHLEPKNQKLKQIDLSQINPQISTGDSLIKHDQIPKDKQDYKKNDISISDQPRQYDQSAFTERVEPQEQGKLFLQQAEKCQTQNDSVNNHSELAYLLEARLIGQVFKTYLLLEYEDQFIMIDQHAAHERILYESLHEQYMANKNSSENRQILLEPITLELNQMEMALIEENIESILQLGYEIDIFGEKTLIIRSVPDTKAGKIDIKASFEAIVDSLVDGSFFQADKRDELLYTVACKAAVKSHDNLSYQEMKKIIEDLLSLKNPFHCPHGRPLIITLTRKDLDKLFRRIV